MSSIGEVSSGACAADDISWRSSGLAVFQVSPAQKRVEKLLSIGDEFLSCEKQPALSWLELLGVLSSLIPWFREVDSGCARFNFCVDLGITVTNWCSAVGLGLSTRPRVVVQSHLEEGESLSQVSPNLDFCSDASDVGWGAHVGGGVVSGCWSPQEVDLSINARELLAVERGLCHFASR